MKTTRLALFATLAFAVLAFSAEQTVQLLPDQTANETQLRDSLAKTQANFDELYNGAGSAATVTYAATTNVDFTLAAFQTVTLTGNVTFTDSNLAPGQTVALRVIASGGSRNLTLPAGWVNIGAAAPTAVASGKTGLFILRSFGTADSAVVYRYEVQP